MSCPFCAIVTGAAPAEVVHEWPEAVAIRPRSGGVHPGHLLVVSRVHVADVGADPAVELLADRWRGPEELVVLSPESRDGVRAETYREQVLWERRARAVATVILYWIWRDMLLTPGQTTNVEYGYDVASGRAIVLGCPPECPDACRNRYLIFTAEEEGVPLRTTLPDAVATALELVLARVPISG
ncbi:hypothetical protein SUDANB95_07978 (plasmid) [Actinosynnema sp. ALI-1.44]